MRAGHAHVAQVARSLPAAADRNEIVLGEMSQDQADLGADIAIGPKNKDASF
jgi:hypothetical protein